MNRKEILRDYIELSIQADLVLEVIEEVEQKGRDITAYQTKADKLNKKLAEMEDENPWIAKVLIAMDGT